MQGIQSVHPQPACSAVLSPICQLLVLSTDPWSLIHSLPSRCSGHLVAVPAVGTVTNRTTPATIAVLLGADTSAWQPASDAVQQAWHSLKLATLHSIWSAAQLAQVRAEASQPLMPTKKHIIITNGPASSLVQQLAGQLALTAIRSMQDWVKCSEDIKQVNGSALAG